MTPTFYYRAVITKFKTIIGKGFRDTLNLSPFYLFDCMTAKMVTRTYIDLFLYISCGVVCQSQQNQGSNIQLDEYCYIYHIWVNIENLLC